MNLNKIKTYVMILVSRFKGRKGGCIFKSENREEYSIVGAQKENALSLYHVHFALVKKPLLIMSNTQFTHSSIQSHYYYLKKIYK